MENKTSDEILDEFDVECESENAHSMFGAAWDVYSATKEMVSPLYHIKLAEAITEALRKRIY